MCLDFRRSFRRINHWKASGSNGSSRLRSQNLPRPIRCSFYGHLHYWGLMFPSTLKGHQNTKSKVICLNDYWLVSLMSIVKCFKGLIMALINSYLSKNLDSLQYAYHHNRSRDRISLALHYALDYLENKKHTSGCCSSTKLGIHIIIPSKLRDLGLYTSLATGSTTSSNITQSV